MIKAVVIACLLVAVTARPNEILSYDAEDHKHEQKGEAGTAVSGSYSYKDADGKEYTIEYVADENGYRATGAHLPVAPEVPEVPAAPVAEEPKPVVKEAAPAVTYFRVASPYYSPYYAAPFAGYPYSYGYPYAGYSYAVLGK